MGIGGMASERPWLPGGWHLTQGRPSERQLQPFLERSREARGAERSSLGTTTAPV